jgi:hypothetical protein
VTGTSAHGDVVETHQRAGKNFKILLTGFVGSAPSREEEFEILRFQISEESQ